MAVDASRETPVVAHQAHDIVMGWSPGGGQLLFASDRTGSMGLWSQPVANGKPNGTPLLLKPDIGAVTSLGLTASGTLHVMKDASTTKLMLALIDLASGKLSGPPVVENYVQSTRPDWTRDGKYMAYPSTGTNGIRSLTIRSVETGEIRELRPRLKYYNEPRWMPDGKSLITFARDFKWRAGIYRIDAQTADTTFITNCRWITRVQVSPDGRKIYYGVDQSPRDPNPPGIAERDLTSGETRILYRMPEGEGRGVGELSPDGRYLAVAFAKPPAVVLVPTHSGEPKEIIRVNPPEYFNAFGHMTWTPDSKAVIAVKVIGDRRELWLLPVSGGNARKLDVDMKEWMSGPGIRLHPNGKQISFSSGQSIREVWALENLLPTLTASK